MRQSISAVMPILLAGALCACAGTAPRQPATDNAMAPAKAAEEEHKTDRNCLRETGSRIPREEGECIGAPGRVLDREELDRSGALTLGDKLRRSGL